MSADEKASRFVWEAGDFVVPNVSDEDKTAILQKPEVAAALTAFFAVDDADKPYVAHGMMVIAAASTLPDAA